MRFGSISLKNKSIIRESLISILVRVVGAFSAFFMTIVVARKFGADESGYYFLGFSIILMLATVARMGLDNSIIRFIGADPSFSKSVIFKALFLSLVSSTILSVLLFFFSEVIALSFLHDQNMAKILQGISLGVIGLTLLTVTANALQGLGRVVWSVLILNVAINVLLIVFLLIVPLEGADEISVAFSAFSIMVGLLGMLIFLKVKPKSSSIISWNELLGSCLPLWVVMIMAQLVQWSGQLIAMAFVGPEEVARLVVAQRTAALISFILIAVNLVMAPKFSRLYATSAFHELRALAINSVRLLSLVTLPIVCVILIFPSYVMGLFGADFVGGSAYLQILAIGQLVHVACGSVGFLLIMSGHERDMRSVTLISGCLAVFLCYVLTMHYGAMGSAVGTALAVSLQSVIAVYYVKIRLGFNMLAVWKG